MSPSCPIFYRRGQHSLLTPTQETLPLSPICIFLGAVWMNPHIQLSGTIGNFLKISQEIFLLLLSPYHTELISILTSLILGFHVNVENIIVAKHGPRPNHLWMYMQVGSDIILLNRYYEEAMLKDSWKWTFFFSIFWCDTIINSSQAPLLFKSVSSPVIISGCILNLV